MRARGPAWRALVPVICLVAGLSFAASARTADGTDLRADRQVQLADLIETRDDQVATQALQVSRLRADVERLTRTAAGADARVAAAERAAQRLALPGGLGRVTGPALTVRLDDAPRPGPSAPPVAGVPRPEPDDLVVHQQDVQAVVNALWAGGAEAMTIMGQRVVPTSAVRCVGNTLLLAGRVWSPPFVVTALGDAGDLRAALGREPGVRIFRQYVSAYGLGYDVSAEDRVTLPAFEGSLRLRYATAAAR